MGALMFGLLFLVAESGGALAAPIDPTGLEPDDELEAAVELRGPRLLTDVLVLSTTTTAWAAVNPNVRSGVIERGSVRHIVRNFNRPIGRAIEGGREDRDHWTTNYLAHPVSWGMLGLYLRERGYSSRSALALSQAHSLVWEYVVEGSYMKPSGKDLVVNLLSATTAIYVLHPVSERAATRDRREPQHVLLALLNPLRPIRGLLQPSRDASLSLVPEPEGWGFALQLDLTW